METPHTSIGIGTDHIEETDLVILGAGCAGLSLAARLASHSNTSPIRFVVVEPRSVYVEDRTWCGWRTNPHFFEDCAIHAWHSWHVHGDGQDIVSSSASYPYEMIDPLLVYQKTKRLVDASDNGELLLGKKALEVTEQDDHVTVRLDDGSTIRSRWVIDTRPEHRELAAPWVWQNFVGYVVTIDDDAVTHMHMTHSRNFSCESGPLLMDFQNTDDAVAQFMYVLPYDKNTYLCECTRFSGTHGETSLLEADLIRWLDMTYGQSWHMIRSEHGSLPMAPATAHHGTRIINAGTRGGSMRIATGYAFHRIQQWADACAKELQKGLPPIGPKSNRVLDDMDEIFLRVLGARHSGTGHSGTGRTMAEQVFVDLFRNCPTNSLIRFLTDGPKLRDYCAVIWSLPWPPFIRQAFPYVIAHIFA